MRTAIDTNAISALWSAEPNAEAVALTLGTARDKGGLVVCGAVYAELRAHPHAARTFVDGFLAEAGIEIDFALDEALWQEVAARFAEYAARRRKAAGGQPKRVLADFVVGSHALLRADRLLTLDPQRYQKDFPEVALLGCE